MSRARVRLTTLVGVGANKRSGEKALWRYGVGLILHLGVKYVRDVRANVGVATSASDARASKRSVRVVSLCVRVELFRSLPSSVFVLIGYASLEVSSGFGSGAASWKTPFAGGGFGVDPGGHMRRMLVAFSGMQ